MNIFIEDIEKHVRQSSDEGLQISLKENQEYYNDRTNAMHPRTVAFVTTELILREQEYRKSTTTKSSQGEQKMNKYSDHSTEDLRDLQIDYDSIKEDKSYPIGARVNSFKQFLLITEELERRENLKTEPTDLEKQMFKILDLMRHGEDFHRPTFHSGEVIFKIDNCIKEYKDTRK